MIIFNIILFTFLLLYLYVLHRYSLGLHKVARQQRNGQKLPVSVIVCAHNEEDNLSVCLERLAVQNYPKNLLEFIIVNDRSTDRTAEIIDEMCRRNSRFKRFHITDLVPDFAPKKRAIDTAIGYASGEIILLTDADGRPGPDWIATIVSYYHDDTDMVLGYAPYHVEENGSISKKILALEYLSHAAISSAGTGAGYPLTCVGTNMSYRKKVYTNLDGFGEYKAIISGDDDLFLTRVRESGDYNISYACDQASHVYNDPPDSMKSFIHQRIRYASKGFDYPFAVSAGLTMYYFFYVLILIGLIGGIFSKTMLMATLTIFLIKALVDYLFMRKTATILHDKRFLHLMPLAEILHLPYVLIFGLLGQIKQYQWADTQTNFTS